MVATAAFVAIQIGIFFFGASIGSFVNVVALRYGREKTFKHGRSQCPHCHHTLSWRELIPLVSFIIQKARCRHCQEPVNTRYFLVELAMGAIALSLFWSFPLTTTELLQNIILFLIISLLLILFLIDADTFLLPDKYIFILTLLVVVFVSLQSSLTTIGPFLGAAIGSGFLGLLWLVTKGRGIGLGDVKLMAPLGFLFSPWHTGLLLFVAFGTGAIVASYLLLTRKATPKTAIPFGPYLCGVAIIFLTNPTLPAALKNFIWP